VTDVGLKLTVTPLGTLLPHPPNRLTCEIQPPKLVTVIDVVWEVDPEEGTVKTKYEGLAETVKSALGGGGFTVSVN
jgi:hypothetical protein